MKTIYRPAIYTRERLNRRILPPSRMNEPVAHRLLLLILYIYIYSRDTREQLSRGKKKEVYIYIYILQQQHRHRANISAQGISFIKRTLALGTLVGRQRERAKTRRPLLYALLLLFARRARERYVLHQLRTSSRGRELTPTLTLWIYLSISVCVCVYACV